MSTQVIQRQYDEVIAAHYDQDPQAVIGSSLNRALGQLNKEQCLDEGVLDCRVLDVGVGTGTFLEKLTAVGGRPIQPFGLDLSAKMVEEARKKLPDLVAEVDDAVNLEQHFPDQSFDLVCTHFITGFVPMRVPAPKIWGRLEEGGYWSFVGGTKAGFPALQAKANGALLRRLFGGGPLAVDDLVCNPANREEVVQTLQSHGFAVRACEVFEPKLHFRGFDDFMEFGYRGGWLTPFIEALGLHRAGALTRFFLNTFVFPMTDRHHIVIALAQKDEHRP